MTRSASAPTLPKVDVPLASQTPPAGQVNVRSAVPRDAAEICRLVNAWADQGLTLRRTQEEIRANSGEFVVAERGDGLIACGALAVFSPALAEIRSIAVDPAATGSGAGRLVVAFLMDLARVFEIDELVLLTKIPAFFAKFGFRSISPEDLPRVFVEEAIAGRGRTIVGRTVMLRELWRED
ncbi:MAG: GNAT family N-acetyltransferase [Phycisphaeraceae bacterium]|nr:GNAT family N-acetyltransferase [Phycisphaeraceae bacterium]